MTKRITTDEILSQYGLDFLIEKAPLSATKADGTIVISPYYGLINTSTNSVINTVKTGYTVSQNREVVDMVLQGMAKFGDKLSVTKAGALNDGRKVFLQLEIEGHGKVGDDIVKQFVTVIDSNDGSTGLSVGIGDLTMSCSNQFFKFYKAGEAKFRHTATITDKIKSIPNLIETALGESLKQIKIYRGFQSTPVSRDLANKMVKAVLGYDKVITSVAEQAKLTGRSINMMDKLYSHIEKEMNQKGNNMWGLHSGVTSYVTHETKGAKRVNGDIESLLTGGGYTKFQDSFNFALKESKLQLV